MTGLVARFECKAHGVQTSGHEVAGVTFCDVCLREKMMELGVCRLECTTRRVEQGVVWQPVSFAPLNKVLRARRANGVEVEAVKITGIGAYGEWIIKGDPSDDLLVEWTEKDATV